MISKFRAYLKIQKKIVDVREIDYRCNCIIWMNEKYTEIEGFEDIELLQYTGLKDKNGVEIFEGDVVSCFKEGLSVIEYHHGGFGLTCNGYFESFINAFGEVEVLGNKHEHPYLLEGDNE